ncbi:MAG: flagellar basal body P-ring protein FlgI [Myxococcales bacterium]|nr:flagellar basal body P-ring protein FlgI [Myxococcales bacterium]
MRSCALLLAVALPLLAPPAAAERIKDISNVHGVRANQLFGYGLVVGLKGTGDTIQSRFTTQSLAAMLGRQGVRIDPREIQVRNVAAVMVTADLPPFARSGARLDVVVSSIGNARSLNGGTLLFTPLKAADGNVYAVAQGSLSVGGFDVQGGGSSLARNHTTAGRVPQGALVEREVPVSLAGREEILLDLANPDFTTAARVAEAINAALQAELAEADDPGRVRVRLPEDRKNKLVSLVAQIEALEIAPDTVARVVLNERTGTLVMGEAVRIAPVAVSHGSLQLEIRSVPVVSQPEPFSRGTTVSTSAEELSAQEQAGGIRLIERGATLGDVVRALNAIGASPRDLIDILQAIRAAGALPARLEIL